MSRASEAKEEGSLNSWMPGLGSSFPLAPLLPPAAASRARIGWVSIHSNGKREGVFTSGLEEEELEQLGKGARSRRPVVPAIVGRLEILEQQALVQRRRQGEALQPLAIRRGPRPLNRNAGGGLLARHRNGLAGESPSHPCRGPFSAAPGRW